MTRVTLEDHLALIFYFVFWWAIVGMIAWNLSFVWHVGIFDGVRNGLAALVLAYATVWLAKG